MSKCSSPATSAEILDLPSILRSRTPELAFLAIDISIGLFDHTRACDIAARQLLGWPRRNSVFPVPCRAALAATTYAEACATNLLRTSKKLSRQTYCIAPKIKEVDDAITPDSQRWAFEVHPEVCFWALNEHRPMGHNKKTREGVAERISVLKPVFAEIERHLLNRPPGVGMDDLLDAAAAAWTALRLHNGEARQVCEPERDEKGLSATIWY